MSAMNARDRLQGFARFWRSAAALAASLALVACAAGPASLPMDTSAELASCHRWYRDLDLLVQRSGVADAQDRRIEGFPQLRQSRWSASFRDRAGRSDAAFGAWFGQMRELGDEGSAVEIANVPESAWLALLAEGGADLRAQALARTRACAELLSREDQARPERRASLLARPGVADSYSALARFLGVYAVTRLPFGAGVKRWQEETQVRFSQPAAPGAGPVLSYVPAPSAVGEPADALLAAPRDALGIPRLSEDLSQRLLDRHAPILEIAPEGAFDRFGEMRLSAEGAPSVDAAKPVVYRRIAFARHGKATLVQLVYLYWFAERPKTGPLDLLGGTLDGVMWRVTLDEAGRPLVYDSAHACGCYHLFFPTPWLRLKASPEPGTEWAFVPALAPQVERGERVVLRIDARTHYLSGVSSTTDFAGVPYMSLPASGLRSLPLGSPGSAARRSSYGPDGIVPGTERGERYFFWPMGVRDAGAQRQWGHHATAFVGRRHFDDPDLIERRFERVGTVPDAQAGAVDH
jgi:hypothetical protein